MVREASQSRTSPPVGDEGVWDNLVLSWRLYRDPRVSNWIKRLPVVLAVVYLIVPIDLIPDMFLGVGQLDDLGVMGLMALSLSWLPRFAPADVVAEHRQRRSSGNSGEAKDSGRSGVSDDPPRRGSDNGNVIDPPYRVR